MEALRTSDDRFDGLAGYPFAPHYVEVPSGTGSGTLRVHYVDEGPADATDTVLLLHGEPSWSYLYRSMIPPIATAGYRVIAPDLVGFGRSDKPAARDDYTYQRHVDWMTAALEAIDLSHITLFCQDWGGLIGLRLAAEMPDRFDRVVAANTFLPTGDQPPGKAFLNWQNFSQTVEDFAVGQMLNFATNRDLSPEEIAAYDAPYPDDTFKAGARQFPMLVPTSPDDPAAAANRAAWEVLGKSEKPFLTAFNGDAVFKGADRALQERIPGAAGQPHTVLDGDGHFLQEDNGPELAQIIIDFIRTDPGSA